MSDGTQEYLNSLDETHNPASVEDDGFAKLPDGDYQARLDKLYISRAKSKSDGTLGRMQCVFEFEVINGQHSFRKIKKFSGMDNAAALDWLTKDLRRIGIETFKWGDVEKQFSKPLDKLFGITLQSKTKGDKTYQSVYINKLLDQNELMVSKSLQEDDVPF